MQLDSDKVIIIAELSGNHLHQYDLAVKTIEAIKESGADFVKVQTLHPDSITLDCRNKYFRISGGTLWDGKTLHDLYQEIYTPWEWQPKLQKIAKDLGLGFFSSPFDRKATDFLEKLNVPAYKVASFEITDIPLIEHIASKGKPIILSTGIATLEEIHDAVSACKRMGNEQIALLKCTSAYPTPLNEVNLKAMPTLAETFNTVVGISDHTLGSSVPAAAVALGGRIIEKHFILARNLGGADAPFSLEPQEFKTMVQTVREVEQALGNGQYHLTEKNRQSRIFARSLFVIEDVEVGEIFTEKNVRSIRPGHGLPPKDYGKVLGKKATQDIKRGTPLSWGLINSSQ